MDVRSWKSQEQSQLSSLRLPGFYGLRAARLAVGDPDAEGAVNARCRPK